VVEILYPPKLRRGDEIRIVAPSRSRAMVTEHDHTAIIEGRLAELGLSLSYGAHVDERTPLTPRPSGRGWLTCTPRSPTRRSPPS
jgi:muramoyltetrapeptide carboxypeptidase LdcA involved in peptidoglycan recycling